MTLTPQELWKELELSWGQALRRAPTKAIAGVLLGRKGAVKSPAAIVRWARRICWDWVARSHGDREFCFRVGDALNMIEKIYEEQPELLRDWCEP
jgi:hypothetical protein